MKSKSKIFSVFFILIMLLTLTALFAACDNDSVHTHSYVHHPAVNATCTIEGNIEYWSCTGCDKIFSDNQETIITASTVIPKTEHTYSTEWTNNDTHHYHECTVCGNEKDKAKHTLIDNRCTECNAVMPTEGLSYTLNDDGESYMLSGIGSSQDMYINIPSTYEGKHVTHIKNNAFKGNKTVKILIVPDSVVSIGDFAFSSCSALTNITFGHNVTTIGEEAFAECVLLNDIILPEKVTTIKSGAFLGCTALTEITIPYGITIIDEWVFSDSDNLTTVILPETITTIGNFAFDGCTSLINIIIPDSVTSIGNFAFSRCRSLSNISLPDGITIIPYSAFDQCAGLTTVILPDSVLTIDSDAFRRCKSLTSFIIPDNVTSIGNNAFMDCENLTNILIGKSVTSIGQKAFSGCLELKEVYYNGSSEEWDNIKIQPTDNAFLIGAAKYYYSETQPITDGNYWHYVDGTITKW